MSDCIFLYRKSFGSEDMIEEEICDEIKVLERIDHHSIVKYIETFQDEKFFYVIMELCEGEELFQMISQRIQEEKYFTESEAAIIMKSLLMAINHCHSEKIAHRDIKPENIIVGADGTIKLIDFGLSKTVKIKELKTIVGSPYYIAPEVLKENYSYQCDIWSLGVILYIMLSGIVPFDGTNATEVFEKIKTGSYSFDFKEWEKVSEDAKDLINGMLKIDIDQRFTATMCLEHSWFKIAEELKENIDMDALDSQLLNNLKQFKGRSVLYKAVLNAFIKMMNPKELKNFKKEFIKMDKDQTGYINAQELREAMTNSDVEIPSHDIDQIINEIDYEGNNKINYSEFLAATIETKKILDENKLLLLFQEFDVDNSGSITKENLKEKFKIKWYAFYHFYQITSQILT